jgi:hypothetical protein
MVIPNVARDATMSPQCWNVYALFDRYCYSLYVSIVTKLRTNIKKQEKMTGIKIYRTAPTHPLLYRIQFLPANALNWPII